MNAAFDRTSSKQSSLVDSGSTVRAIVDDDSASVLDCIDSAVVAEAREAGNIAATRLRTVLDLSIELVAEASTEIRWLLSSSAF